MQNLLCLFLCVLYSFCSCTHLLLGWKNTAIIFHMHKRQLARSWAMFSLPYWDKMRHDILSGLLSFRGISAWYIDIDYLQKMWEKKKVGTYHVHTMKTMFRKATFLAIQGMFSASNLPLEMWKKLSNVAHLSGNVHHQDQERALAGRIMGIVGRIMKQ